MADASRFVCRPHFFARQDYRFLVFPGMVCHTITDVRSEEQLTLVLNPVIAAKQTGLETILSPLVARACLNVMPPAPKRASINVEHVRVCKLIGGSIADSTVIKGVVVQRTTEVSDPDSGRGVVCSTCTAYNPIGARCFIAV